MSDPIESSSEMPNLEANCSDVGAMVVRSTVGLIPFAGPIISELITHFIPNQRQDRIADYVRRLNEKTERFDRNAFRNTATTTDGIDLFEDGAFQSARATSDERREYIANVVAYGLSGEQKERIEAKRILNILSQIGSCPKRWCSFGARRAFRTEPGTCQLAAGRLMSGSSLIVAIVSSVM